MIGLLQRVDTAQVAADGNVIAAIQRGLLVLVGVEAQDGRAEADRLLERLLGYRVFPDGDGRMNLSLRDIGGGLLLVPQFTLAADTGKGARPSFSPAAAPAAGKALFEYLLERARAEHSPVEAGRVGAWSRGPVFGDATAEACVEHAVRTDALSPLPGRTYR